MAKIAFGVEYDGSELVGWQAQRAGRSVQSSLEQAFSAVANQTISVICAGRTDAGVHATAQVVHIDSTVERSMRSWLLGVNSHLPDDISLRWGNAVDDDFHARFSARSRTYQYLIQNREVRSALWRERCCWERCSLDHQAMSVAAQQLTGKHDFSSFRAAPCQAKTPVRTIHRIVIERRGDLLSLTLNANAFLHHMVRNIVGSLLEVGRGDKSPDWLAEVLTARDRRAAGITAPAAGLYLIGVEYDKGYGLPAGPRPADLFPDRIELHGSAGVREQEGSDELV